MMTMSVKPGGCKQNISQSDNGQQLKTEEIQSQYSETFRITIVIAQYRALEYFMWEREVNLWNNDFQNGYQAIRVDDVINTLSKVLYLHKTFIGRKSWTE